mmetsp:Transcript_40219/g.66062  ORF Transcript_40219/g.66062 Transcript_40219/m.66062 type:complete len:174 (-) Transcript_40219:384-905(-)
MFTPEKDNKQLKKKEKAPETPSCQGKLKELDFIASKKFKGARPGYAFKKGNKGLGYYVDVIPTSQISANKKKRRSGGARNKKQSPGGTPKQDPRALSSFGSEKKVRFGAILEKGHKASIKDLKRSVVTPKKSPPAQGVLKKSGETPSSGKSNKKKRRGTPHPIKKRFSSRDFM